MASTAPYLQMLHTAVEGLLITVQLLRLRLAERNAKETAFAPIIEQCTFHPPVGPTFQTR